MKELTKSQESKILIVYIIILIFINFINGLETLSSILLNMGISLISAYYILKFNKNIDGVKKILSYIIVACCIIWSISFTGMKIYTYTVQQKQIEAKAIEDLKSAQVQFYKDKEQGISYELAGNITEKQKSIMTSSEIESYKKELKNLRATYEKDVLIEKTSSLSRKVLEEFLEDGDLNIYFGNVKKDKETNLITGEGTCIYSNELGVSEYTDFKIKYREENDIESFVFGEEKLY